MSLVVYQSSVKSSCSNDSILDLSEVPDGRRFSKVVQHPLYSLILKASDKPTESKVEDVFKRFFTKVTVSSTDTKFYEQTMKLFTSIAHTSTGCEILDRIAKTGKRLFVNIAGNGFDDGFLSAFSYLAINPYQKYYYITVNESGDNEIQEAPTFVVLFHELVHALGFFENKKEHILRQSNCATLDSCLSNQEEERTIGSIQSIDENADVPFKIITRDLEGERVYTTISNSPSENKLLLELGLPPRITHHGLVDYPATLSEMAKFDLVHDFKEMIQKNSFKTEDYFFTFNGLKLSLLSVAAGFGSMKMFECLLSSGMPIDIEDDYGSIVHAAIRKDRYEMALQFITERGIDVDVKNKNGETAYTLLQQKPLIQRFSKYTGPLIEQIEQAIEERSNIRFKVPLDRFRTQPILIEK